MKWILLVMALSGGSTTDYSAHMFSSEDACRTQLVQMFYNQRLSKGTSRVYTCQPLDEFSTVDGNKPMPRMKGITTEGTPT